jgi:hypothetical protein
MSAQDNLSQSQFVNTTLYRGISGSKVQQPLGMHWSVEHGLETQGNREQEGATRFLAGDNEDLLPGEKGTIIHAKPTKEGVTWNKKGDKKFLQESGVFSSFTPKMKEDPYGMYDPVKEHAEAEIPVRPGTPVKVEKLTRVRVTKKSYQTKKREIRYNPPREMQA